MTHKVVRTAALVGSCLLFAVLGASGAQGRARSARFEGFRVTNYGRHAVASAVADLLVGGTNVTAAKIGNVPPGRLRAAGVCGCLCGSHVRVLLEMDDRSRLQLVYPYVGDPGGSITWVDVTLADTLTGRPSATAVVTLASGLRLMRSLSYVKPPRGVEAPPNHPPKVNVASVFVNIRLHNDSPTPVHSVVVHGAPGVPGNPPPHQINGPVPTQTDDGHVYSDPPQGLTNSNWFDADIVMDDPKATTLHLDRKDLACDIQSVWFVVGGDGSAGSPYHAEATVYPYTNANCPAPLSYPLTLVPPPPAPPR